jgi:hypothetical protein
MYRHYRLTGCGVDTATDMLTIGITYIPSFMTITSAILFIYVAGMEPSLLSTRPIAPTLDDTR